MLGDASVFPHLRRSEPGLGPVLDRLHEEHAVIHEVHEQFDRAVVRLVAEDGTGHAGEEVRRCPAGPRPPHPPWSPTLPTRSAS